MLKKVDTIYVDYYGKFSGGKLSGILSDYFWKARKCFPYNNGKRKAGKIPMALESHPENFLAYFGKKNNKKSGHSAHEKVSDKVF